MSKKFKVHVIITGGTIDSKWDAAKDTAAIEGESILPTYFERIKLDVDVTFETVIMKDSRSLLPSDIKSICEAVDKSAVDKIVITHGTYTMPDTARYLEKNMKTNKTVIITGSLIPLQGYEMSDASFNLGFAIGNLMYLPPGVKIGMHGKIFTPSEVAKNFAEARFYSIEQ